MTRFPVQYSIRPDSPEAHLFQVRCAVAHPDPAGQLLAWPVWIPGSYLVREFARHVVGVSASSNGRPVGIRKSAKDLWLCDPVAGPLDVDFRIYAFDLSVRAAYLDPTRGYFNGTSVFCQVRGQEGAPCGVEILPPVDPRFALWRVATTLPADRVGDGGWGSYRAADYDELADHPVELGTFALAAFEAGGARHEIAVSGRHDADMPRLTRDLARICQAQIDLFAGHAGGRAPVDRYLFLTLAVGDGYGGLEHRSSTSLLASRNDLPVAGDPGVPDAYRSFLGLASHEYFHLWNVKRIKPAAFTPYDLGRENYTRQLWVFEGFTSYYDDLMLVRSRVITEDSYLEVLGRTITQVLRTPGRSLQSLADSSFDAWIKYYRPDENTPNAVVSYYLKGALVALALDLTLRRDSAITLDDLMRALWERYGRPGMGVPEDGVPALVNELTRGDYSGFFARFVDGTDDPPLAELLAAHGVTLHSRPGRGNGDRGGTPADATRRNAPWLGARVAGGDEARITHVLHDGPAQRAGLSGGDVLVAIDGIRAKGSALEERLSRFRAGDSVTVHAFRRDELIVTAVTLVEAPLDTAWLTLEAGSAPEVLARRDRWLRGTVPASPASTPPAD